MPTLPGGAAASVQRDRVAPLIGRLPETLAAIAEKPLGAAEIADAIDGRRLRIAAMGGSYNAAVAALPELWRHGVDARADLASVLLHYAGDALAPDDAYVLVSASGTSVETVRLAEKLRDLGATRIVGITNNPDSPFARAVTTVVDHGLSTEESFAFGLFPANYLALRNAAALHAGTSPASPAALGEAAEATRAASMKLLERFPTPPPVIEYLGRGGLVGSAQQATLITREIARVTAVAWDGSNYRHGPIESISDDLTTVVLAATQSPFSEQDRSLATHLRSITYRLLTVGPTDADVPTVGPAEFQPILTVLPVVFLSYAWALAAGHAPGEFRYTSHSITDEL